MVVLKNQNRRSGIFYLRPLCGFGFFSKSDFSAIFFSHFRSSTDSFLKFSLSRLQINAKYACSVSLSWLVVSSAVCKVHGRSYREMTKAHTYMVDCAEYMGKTFGCEHIEAANVCRLPCRVKRIRIKHDRIMSSCFQFFLDSTRRGIVSTARTA